MKPSSSRPRSSSSASPDDLSSSPESASNTSLSQPQQPHEVMRSEPVPQNSTHSTGSMSPTTNGTVSSDSSAAIINPPLDPDMSATAYAKAMHQHTERQMAVSLNPDGRTNSGDSSSNPTQSTTNTTHSRPAGS
ncbi:hypothetical protein FQN54_009688 [Arachnomyces sp. PD_36]|nr:hypothetical protein FQN54_009688 [Arachnomyces sp. PD_36]